MTIYIYLFACGGHVDQAFGKQNRLFTDQRVLMSNNNSDSKRTRSQLALPDRILNLPLTRSPLKDARIALRNQFQPLLHTPEREASKGTVDEANDSDDEILLSPRKKAKSKHYLNAISSPTPTLSTKRPSSPLDECTLTPGPDRKRARHNDPPSDIENTQHHIPRTPTHIVSAPAACATGTRTRSRPSPPSVTSKDFTPPLESITGDILNLHDVDSNPGGSGSNALLTSHALSHSELTLVPPSTPQVTDTSVTTDCDGPAFETAGSVESALGGTNTEGRNQGIVGSTPFHAPLPVDSSLLTVPLNPPPTSHTSFVPLSPLPPIPATPIQASLFSKDRTRILSNLHHNIFAEPEVCHHRMW